MRDIRERTGRLSCQFILRRARQCVSYVDFYTLHLTNASLMAEEKDEMGKVEEELSYEELAILRKVAMQRVREQYKVQWSLLNLFLTIMFHHSIG